MKITTQNELAALLVGVRLGRELELSFNDYYHEQHGDISIDDGGCEGWYVKLIDGRLIELCAQDNQTEEVETILRQSAELAALIHKNPEAGE